jgi:predicted enzyme related to lactoylglutathione lyase
VVKLDHLSLPVSDWKRSRDFYVDAFGFTVEFELPEGGAMGLGVAALQDDAGLTLFLDQVDTPVQSGRATYALQVEDVESVFARVAGQGASVLAAPGTQFWGYGAVISDPDGHILHLWDEASMAANQ